MLRNFVGASSFSGEASSGGSARDDLTAHQNSNTYAARAAASGAGLPSKVVPELRRVPTRSLEVK